MNEVACGIWRRDKVTCNEAPMETLCHRRGILDLGSEDVVYAGSTPPFLDCSPVEEEIVVTI